jgi:hypothetical protein
MESKGSLPCLQKPSTGLIKKIRNMNSKK